MGFPITGPRRDRADNIKEFLVNASTHINAGRKILFEVALKKENEIILVSLKFICEFLRWNIAAWLGSLNTRSSALRSSNSARTDKRL